MFSIVTTWYMTSLIAIRLCIKLTFSVTPNICSSRTRCKYGYCKTSNLAIDPLDQNYCLVTFNYLCWFHNVKEPLSLMRNHVRTVQIAVIVTPMFVFNYAYSSVPHLNSSFLSSSLRTKGLQINCILCLYLAYCSKVINWFHAAQHRNFSLLLVIPFQCLTLTV